MPKRKISITIDEKLLGEIDALGSQTRRNRSEQIETLCSRALELEPVSTSGASFTIRAPLPMIVDGFISLGLNDPALCMEGTLRPDPEGRRATGEEAEICRMIWRSLKQSQIARAEVELARNDESESGGIES
jgi:hypothetical protein